MPKPFLMALGLVTLTACAAAAPKFRVVAYQMPAGAQYCGADTVIDNGSVTGYCAFPGFVWGYYRWHQDGSVTPRSVSYLFPSTRNNRGQGVGFTRTGSDYNSFFLQRGKAPIPFLKGTWAEYGGAVDMNDRGHVLGSSSINGYDPVPWLWSTESGLTNPFDAPRVIAFM